MPASSPRPLSSPSPYRKPAASSSSCPGGRMITAIVSVASCPASPSVRTRTSSGSSTASSSRVAARVPPLQRSTPTSTWRNGSSCERTGALSLMPTPPSDARAARSARWLGREERAVDHVRERRDEPLLADALFPPQTEGVEQGEDGQCRRLDIQIGPGVTVGDGLREVALELFQHMTANRLLVRHELG